MFVESSMDEDIPEFGNRAAGAEYVLRPGGYLVAQNSAGEIAVVRTPKGYFLPGGGQEAGEDLEQTAVRETLEECGLHVEISGTLGTADQLVHSPSKNTFYRKRCTFFSAELVDLAGAGEADHELVWMSPAETAAQLKHESQVWAVKKQVRTEK